MSPSSHSDNSEAATKESAVRKVDSYICSVTCFGRRPKCPLQCR